MNELRRRVLMERLWRKGMTREQGQTVTRLLDRGWLGPRWVAEGGQVALGLPLPARVRRERGLPAYRVYARPGVRVLPSGEVVADKAKITSSEGEP